jgi:hypothetical protein
MKQSGAHGHAEDHRRLAACTSDDPNEETPTIRCLLGNLCHAICMWKCDVTPLAYPGDAAEWRGECGDEIVAPRREIRLHDISTKHLSKTIVDVKTGAAGF